MEFKKACRLKGLSLGRGGQRKEIVNGEIVCDGLFGIDGSEKRWCLTHIPTGRNVGYYRTKAIAKACAEALAQVQLPWASKTMKEWNKAKGTPERKEAAAIADRFRML